MKKQTKNIFKEYDIRGIYPKEINGQTIYKIGQSLVNFLSPRKGEKLVVGRDGRPSSKILAEKFIQGIIDSGIDVIDIGKVSTPMFYFAVNYLRAKGGGIITASHNPNKYNGVKMVDEKVISISGKDIEEIFKKIKTKKVKQKGVIEKINIKDRYLQKSLGDLPLRKIPFSFSFDKDGDRLIVYDKDKKPIRGDIIGGIIADAIAKKKNIIIYDLRCSKTIREYFRNKGVRAFPSKVGHYHIQRLMREKKAVFGMEMSGHYYFKKFNYRESPEYALRILTEHIKKTGKKIKDLSRPFTKYFHSGVIDIPLKKEVDFEKIADALREKYSWGAVNLTDGITIEFSSWWFNLRKSNTEPVLRLVIEASSEKMLEEKKKEIKEIILDLI